MFQEDKMTTVPDIDHNIVQTCIKFYAMKHASEAGPFAAQGYIDNAYEGYRPDVLIRFYPKIRNPKLSTTWVCFEVQYKMKDKSFIEKIKTMRARGLKVAIIPLDEISADRDIDNWKKRIEERVLDAVMAYVK